MISDFSHRKFLGIGALAKGRVLRSKAETGGGRSSKHGPGGGLWVALICALFLYGSVSSFCQMVNPSIDAENQPFSYFSHPTDEIGVMGAQTATLISPEGFMFTGYGELMFFSGNPPVAIEQRIKTLKDGYLPVINYEFVRDGVHYQFTAFAATLDGSPSGVLVDFMRVTIKNDNSEPSTAWISTGMRYEGNINTETGYADYRYTRPAIAKKVGEYYQPGQPFDVKWKYSSDQDSIQRDGKIMYCFPTSLAHSVRYVFGSDVSKNGVLEPRALNVLPSTPMGIVQYAVHLKPGETTVLDWKLPVIPVQSASPSAVQICSATFDQYLPQVVRGWQNIVQHGIDIDVPEPKVNDTFKASLIYDLIALNKVGNDYVQTVNDFGYHSFFLRDGSNIVRMYDVSGYHDYAQKVLEFFPRWQQSDGNYLTYPGQFDGVGQALWAYGEHYRITHDKAFADQVYPSVVRAVRWIEQARKTDPWHIMPVTDPHDDEEIVGHITGHNFWALDGLDAAIALARATGHTQDAAEFTREYNDYKTALVKVLNTVTQKTGGYIPPGLDGQGGQDWGNMMAVYPGIVLDPHDPKVTATLNTTRAKYQEGIMTWERYLHHYITLKNTETEVIRGDQQLAVGELYAVLLHTSSTQAGFELGVLPWGDRDFGDDLSPHGWFAADYRTTLRNMLVREQGTDLHLLSVISPEWIQPGKEIRVERAPTTFGNINFALQCSSNTHANLTVHANFTEAPARIVLHLPWFMNTTRVVANGKSLTILDNSVLLPLGDREVQVDWEKKADLQPMSYERAVADYKAEYARRYQIFLRTGER
jgi:hypothetical protein